MTNKIQRSLRNFNRILDDDYKKLSDKYHDLKLSHNRIERLLQRTLKFFDMFFDPTSHWLESYQEVVYLRPKIKCELKNSLYRCRERKNNERKVNKSI